MDIKQLLSYLLVVLYNKSISKIEIVETIAKELPVPPVLSYFLCDSWYTSEKIINAFAEKGFHTIGALKTNRNLYPYGMQKKLCEFAAILAEKRSDFDLVTVKNQRYYAFRYEGKLNGIENAVILLTYPENVRLSARMYLYVPKKSLIAMWNVGQLKYFSDSARIR